MQAHEYFGDFRLNAVKPDRTGRPARDFVGGLIGKLRALGRLVPTFCGSLGGHPDSQTRRDDLGRRGERRLRTRLRSAKVLDAKNKFLCDCAVVDASKGGLGLRVAPHIPIARQFCLHDDLTREVLSVAVAWRKGASLGVRILYKDAIERLKPVERAALSGRYYGVVD